jgi:uncharacterized cupin superfamily protein
METQPQVFVSNVNPDAWEPDPEVAGGEMHVLCNEGGMESGLSRFNEFPDSGIPWIVPEQETIVVLDGDVKIEVAGGPLLDLHSGDMASLPRDARTIWHPTPGFKMFWVMPR